MTFTCKILISYSIGPRVVNIEMILNELHALWGQIRGYTLSWL